MSMKLTEAMFILGFGFGIKFFTFPLPISIINKLAIINSILIVDLFIIYQIKTKRRGKNENHKLFL